MFSGNEKIMNIINFNKGRFNLIVFGIYDGEMIPRNPVAASSLPFPILKNNLSEVQAQVVYHPTMTQFRVASSIVLATEAYKNATVYKNGNTIMVWLPHEDGQTYLCQIDTDGNCYGAIVSNDGGKIKFERELTTDDELIAARVSLIALHMYTDGSNGEHPELMDECQNLFEESKKLMEGFENISDNTDMQEATKTLAMFTATIYCREKYMVDQGKGHKGIQRLDVDSLKASDWQMLSGDSDGVFGVYSSTSSGMDSALANAELEPFINGEYMLGDGTDAPSLDPTEVPARDALSITKRVYRSFNSNQKIDNILLYGVNGSGKSSIVKDCASFWGLRHAIYCCHESSDLIEMLYEYAPNMDGNGPDYKRIESPLLFCIRNGGVIELQEPNIIRQEGVLTGFNSLLEEGVITVAGEKVQRHPNCIIFFTMNRDYSATRPLNQSCLSRMRCVKHIPLPETDELAKRIASRSGLTDLKKVKEVIRIVQMAIERKEEIPYHVDLSTREMITLCNSLAFDPDYDREELFRETVLERIYLDREVEGMYDDILSEFVSSSILGGGVSRHKRKRTI